MSNEDNQVVVVGLALSLQIMLISLILLANVMWCHHRVGELTRAVNELTSCVESGAEGCHIEQDTDGSLGVYSHE